MLNFNSARSNNSESTPNPQALNWEATMNEVRKGVNNFGTEQKKLARDFAKKQEELQNILAPNKNNEVTGQKNRLGLFEKLRKTVASFMGKESIDACLLPETSLNNSILPRESRTNQIPTNPAEISPKPAAVSEPMQFHIKGLGESRKRTMNQTPAAPRTPQAPAASPKLHIKV